MKTTTFSETNSLSVLAALNEALGLCQVAFGWLFGLPIFLICIGSVALWEKLLTLTSGGPNQSAGRGNFPPRSGGGVITPRVAFAASR
jgi:hypothetical protein